MSASDDRLTFFDDSSLEIGRQDAANLLILSSGYEDVGNGSSLASMANEARYFYACVCWHFVCQATPESVVGSFGVC